MKKFISTLTIIFLGLSASAQMKPVPQISRSAKGYAQQAVLNQARKEPLHSAQFGVMAVNLKGDTLACYQAEKKMIPASTMKLISTGLALRTLGPEFQYKTRLAYSGTIEEGELKGDLYIVGGGDPTLGSKDSIAIRTDQLFDQWTGFVKQAGIRKIAGRIIGDGRWLDGEMENGNWCYEDLGTYYGAGGNGLCFYRNITDIQVGPGAAVGAPISMSIRYPQMPWLQLKQNCQTGPEDTGDRLYLYTNDLSYEAEMRGTLALEHYSKKLECSNKFGALTCAYYFYRHLQERAIPASGYCQIDGYGRVSETFVETGGMTSRKPSENVLDAGDLQVIGITYSPELKRIAALTNYRSDNFYAETLMRTMTKESRGRADYRTCQRFYADAFKEMGLHSSLGRVINDGSGLSRRNYIAPEFFCRFLRAMICSSVAEDYIGTLASPGDEHYPSRLRNEPDSLKKRIYMKSGSMNGVRCFCGYVEPQSGIKEDTIVFSVMSNNCTEPDWQVYPILDEIIAAIAYEN